MTSGPVVSHQSIAHSLSDRDMMAMFTLGTLDIYTGNTTDISQQCLLYSNNLQPFLCVFCFFFRLKTTDLLILLYKPCTARGQVYVTPWSYFIHACQVLSVLQLFILYTKTLPKIALLLNVYGVILLMLVFLEESK